MRKTAMLGLGSLMASLLLSIALFADFLAPFNPTVQVTDSLGVPQPPGAVFHLGTDDLGRDVLSRLIQGARLSLLVGFTAMVITVAIGSLVGILAGYFGGFTDALLMRITDVMLAFPGLLLAVALVSVMQPSICTILIVIGLVSWTGVARVVRADVLALCNQDFVLAGQAVGGSNLGIIRRHLLPNVASTILVMAALSTSTTILLDAGLSFLGIGVPPPTPTWGRMIQEASAYYRTAPWLMLFPGLAVLFAVLAFNFIGYGLLEKMRKITRSGLCGLLILSAALSAAAGCDPGKDQADEIVPASRPAGARYGGVLRLASSDDVPTLDPAVGYDSLSWFFEQLIFDTLLDYDEKGRLVPRLASSWNVSQDGKNYTFHLPPGLLFSDGRRLTASDFVFSIERVLNPRTGSQGAEFFRGIRGAGDFAAGKSPHVAGLKADNENTITIGLAYPDPLFLHKLTLLFSSVVPEHAVREHGSEFSSNPIGSGPFALREWKRGNSIRLRRNPHYRKPTAVYLDGVEQLVGVTEQLAWLKFESGELDVVLIPLAEFPRVIKDPAYDGRIVRGITMTTAYIGINCRIPPLDQIEVRRALNYAVDKVGVIKLLGGRGVEALGVLPPNMPGFDATMTGYPYDPQRARRLLAAAGLAHGFETVLWTQSRETDLRVAQKIQQDLAAVGVSAKIKTVAWSSFLEAIREPGMVPLFDLGWFADFPDPANFLEVLFDGRNLGANNHTFYNNPQVNKLLDQARQTADQKRRIALYQKVERIVVAEAPWIFLYHPITYAALQPRVHNYRIHPLRPPRIDRVWVDRGSES